MPHGGSSIQHRVPLEEFFGNPAFDRPQYSPDGTWIAFLAPWKEALNIHLQSSGEEQVRRLTGDSRRGIRFYQWQPDNAHILYLQDDDGDENYHLYQVNIHTGETRDLTPAPGIRAEILANNPYFPDEILIAMNMVNPQYFDVYRMNLRDGTKNLAAANPGDVFRWVADNNLTVRVAQAFTSDGHLEIRVKQDALAPWEVLDRWHIDDLYGNSGVMGFTEDNKSIYCISSAGASTARLLEVEIASGKTKVLAEDGRLDINDAITHPLTHAIVAAQFFHCRSEWRIIDDSLEKDFSVLKETLENDFTLCSSTSSFQQWIIRHEKDRQPAAFYTYDRVMGELSFLAYSFPSLEKFQLSETKPFSCSARDGMELHGYLTLPPCAGADRMPFVVFVHGGPWGRDYWGYDPEVQWLASRGYGVLQINFRGSTGFGRNYFNAGNREWGGKMHTDILDGKNWAIRQGFADPARIAVLGMSYGGYEVLSALAFTPDEFRCGVDIFGPSNLISLLDSIPLYMTPLKAKYRHRMGDIEQDRELLISRSPLFKAGDIKAPLLIAQGSRDVRVKKKESDQIVAALKEKGKIVEYIEFRNEGHGFFNPANRLNLYRAIEEFFEKYLLGEER
jgi:dipeptidyl aminopeptidase/acylaminoacyl peptidase